MSWTYSGDPSQSPKDAVRFILGDTVSSDPLLQDEEITYTLNQNSSVDDAAYAACIGIVAKFSRLADKEVGKIKIKFSQKAVQYQKLADRLYLKAGVVVIPYLGGVSTAEKEAMQSDTSIVQPAFRMGLMDNKRYI